MTPETITSLVNLGSAGAVIIVVIIFLNSIEKRDRQWRDFFTALSSGNEKDIQDMRQTAQRLTGMLENLLACYSAHDTQAKRIHEAVEFIKVEMARIQSGRPNTRRTQT